MTGRGRWWAVLMAMAVAMALSSAWPLLFSGSLLGFALSAAALAIGLVFALSAWLALFATRPWHRAPVRPGGPTVAIVVVSLAFPVLLWTPWLLEKAGILPDTEGNAPAYAAMAFSSALGGRIVAQACKWVTDTHRRSLTRGMMLWGAVWPFLQPLLPPRHRLLGPGGLLIWQLPIGLACAVWFLRSGATSALTERRPGP